MDNILCSHISLPRWGGAALWCGCVMHRGAYAHHVVIY